MNFKKRVNGSWHDTPHYIHNTSTDTITTLPANIYPNAATATVGLSGNTVQSGTPTPDNPIMPQGTGERTGNWFDKSTNIVAYYLTQTTGVYTATSSTSRSALVPCKPSTTYTIHVPTNRTLRIVEFDHYPQAGDAGSNYTSQETGSYIDKDVTVTTTATAKYLCVFCYNSAQEATQYTESAYFAQVMVVEGSTAPSSYIPPGYKIPISSANTTTPVYLGEVESTRQIKQLVLTGNEQFYGVEVPNTNTMIFNFENLLNTAQFIPTVTSLSTHYVYNPIQSGMVVGLPINQYALQYYAAETKYNLLIHDSVYTSVGAFQTYLQQQYAAGTPVCVWYVLANETTGIVNEPIRKIGDYADTVSGITIPTIAGADTFDVLTTLKPSEVDLTYRGWHDTTVKEKSRNLFDYTTATLGKYIDSNGNEQTSALPSPTQRLNHSDYFSVSPNTTYTFSSVKDNSVEQTVAFVWYTSGKTFISRTTEVKTYETTAYSMTTTAPNNAEYAIINYITANNEVMLNTGETVLPYEPYWK